ncbi:hypothetical protein [Pseudoclavibacter sp. RFBG4]|uniref:hypothetical protein n=1 Tax=Pseudoclavibacter sp. RFBG4 TaxID=2080575 RepID=UPI0011B0E2C4|nr:hypothetical protein [Pseudoclavibacter sp. RFBG4]
MTDIGPFSVEPKQIEGLDGSGFADLVSRLLAAEIARAGLAGWTLTQTYRTNAADGGVDAGLSNSIATCWLPEGDSAWQFKAGDLGPAACETELRGANAAVEILKAGGSYRLVLGKSLAPNLIATRKARLENVARALGVEVVPGLIEVLAGDSLARWAEEFPAVASGPSIKGMGTIGQTFGEWSDSVSHTTTWVPSEAREKQIEDLRAAIQTGDESGVHVEGVSGLGKTRLVMEALRGQPNEALVVYVPSEDQFPPAVLNHLQTQGRSAVVVIDECDAKRHDVFAGMLQTGTRIRLVTISEPSQRAPRAATLLVKAFDDKPLSKLLQENMPTLWPEATRVIVEVSAGNIDYALKCAKALIAQRPSFARQLVDPADIRQFIADELPGGALFLASSALALFSRLGFDGDLASEVHIVSAALTIPESDLRAAAAELTAKGLLSSQGRYRSVGPSPVAIYLAAKGWTEFGSRIMTDLIPALTDDLIERLFARAVEIGDASLPRAVVDKMLGESGPLSSLEAVAADRRGSLIEHLAVLSPGRVSRRISYLLGSVTKAELLAASGARRPLIWSLQKLMWHSETFSEAADSLLLLALAENETFSNNSTGVWVDLFGAMLPSTSASPEARLAYLREKLVSEDSQVRSLVVSAAAHALESHESTMVSGELQGGVVVEPRGAPKTWGEVWAYRNAMIDLLRMLADDPDLAVAEDAVKSLTGAIHGVLGIPAVQGHLAATLASLPARQLQLARAELAHLSSLYERTGDERKHAADIDAMIAELPTESVADRLWVITHASPWDRPKVDIEADLLDTLSGMTPAEATASLIDALLKEIPTDFNVGAMIGRLGVANERDEQFLIKSFGGVNSRALTGYLLAKEELSPGAYDDFVDSAEVNQVTKLRLTTQGPRTARAGERIAEYLPSISVADGARAVFYWLREENDEALLRLYVEDWSKRVETQTDYNALVDFIAFAIHGRSDLSTDLEDLIGDVVTMRVDFADVGQQRYDWRMLAERQLDRRPQQLVDTIVQLVESDAVSIYWRSEEQSLFARSIQAAGPTAWVDLMDRLESRGSFKLSLAVRGWLADVVGLSVLEGWVGKSKERARVVASVASVGDEMLSAPASFLLALFGDDDAITTPLIGEFISGGWTGDESIRIRGQVAQVKRWLAEPGLSDGAKRWCARVIDLLESRLGDVEQREQENDW